MYKLSLMSWPKRRGRTRASVVGVTFPAKAYPALDLHSLQFLFMNKVWWGGGQRWIQIDGIAVGIGATTPDGGIHRVSDRHVRSKFCPLNLSFTVLHPHTTGVVIRRFAYPALDFHAFRSLFMNKLFAKLTAFLIAENLRCQDASPAKASQIRLGQYRR
jgi:hypothetical protein